MPLAPSYPYDETLVADANSALASATVEFRLWLTLKTQPPLTLCPLEAHSCVLVEPLPHLSNTGNVETLPFGPTSCMEPPHRNPLLGRMSLLPFAFVRSSGCTVGLPKNSIKIKRYKLIIYVCYY